MASISEPQAPTVARSAREQAEPSRAARLVRRLFEPVNVGLLVFFRIAFGTIMLWEAYRYLRRDPWGNNWIEQLYIEPAFQFKFHGFEWVRPWPGDWMFVHFYVLGALALCIAAGLMYRLSAALFCLGFTYVFLLEQTHYLNHFYLICLVSFLLIFIPAHRAFSLDVLLRPSLRSPTAPAWTLWLLRAQFGMAYLYGGIAKLNADWLFHAEPMRLFINSRLPPDAPAAEPVVWLFAYGGLLFDLLIVPLLLWPKTRVPAFVLAVLFHFANDSLFSIGVFPWMMVAATLLFCPPDWLQVPPNKTAPTRGRKARATRNKRPEVAASSEGLSRGQRWTVALLGIYLAAQLLLPFRHLLYPGNVSWTEEGHNFSWHMKLRVKWADEVEFVAYDPAGNELPLPAALDLLTPRQARSMPTRPEMVLQYAHLLADHLRRQGHDPAAVHARITVSLNGRPPQLLIDPDANLLEKSRSLWPADWIMPLTASIPPGGTLWMTRSSGIPADAAPADAEL